MDVSTGFMTTALPPVIMVHGWAGSFARTWQMSGVETLLQETGRKVIGVDLLGHGTADKPHLPTQTFLCRFAKVQKILKLMPLVFR
jgi:pimeloyl-ACP methyl ester carboxylesterase